MMYWYGSGMSAWGYAFMTTTTVLFLGLITVGVIALVRYLSRSGQGRGAEPPSSTREHLTPEQILAQRFARGEIGEDEYLRRMSVLRSDTDLVAEP
jgi:putative membrane protein